MSTSVLYLIALGSAFTDLLRHKIFNAWIILGGALGVILLFTGFLEGSPKTVLSRIFFALALLLPLYIFKGLGAGDVKLLMVIAIFLNKQELMACIVLALVIGASVGICKIFIKRNIHQKIHFAIPIMMSVLFVTNTGVCL